MSVLSAVPAGACAARPQIRTRDRAWSRSHARRSRSSSASTPTSTARRRGRRPRRPPARPRTFAATRDGYDGADRGRAAGLVTPRGRGGHRLLSAPASRFLRRTGVDVIEVTRAARAGGRHQGKTDPLDAQAAALIVLCRPRNRAHRRSVPGSSNRSVCCAVAAPTAVKARSQAIIQIKSILVAPPTSCAPSCGQLTTPARRSLRLSSTRHAARSAHDHRRAKPCAPSPAATAQLDDEIASLERPARRARRPRRAATARPARRRPRDGRQAAHGRRRQPRPPPQPRRIRRPLRRLPGRSHQRQDRSATGSTAAATAKPTTRSTRSRWSACNTTPRPRPTSPAAPPKARPAARSAAA